MWLCRPLETSPEYRASNKSVSKTCKLFNAFGVLCCLASKMSMRFDSPIEVDGLRFLIVNNWSVFRAFLMCTCIFSFKLSLKAPYVVFWVNGSAYGISKLDVPRNELFVIYCGINFYWHR